MTKAHLSYIIYYVIYDNRGVKVRTTVIIPDELLKDAMQLTHSHTKTDAIITALRNLVRSKKTADVKSLFGKVHIELDPDELEKLEVAEEKGTYK